MAVDRDTIIRSSCRAMPSHRQLPGRAVVWQRPGAQACPPFNPALARHAEKADVKPGTQIQLDFHLTPDSNFREVAQAVAITGRRHHGVAQTV
jgi:hypothetical protein